MQSPKYDPDGLCKEVDPMSLLGILLALALLIWLTYRGWSTLLLAPGAAMLAAVFAGEPPRPLDPDLHVQRGRFRRAVLPAFPARGCSAS